MKTSKIVIVIVNFNGFDDTQDCINSIQNTNGEKPFIVVVDNNSNDKNSLASLKQNYNNLQLILSTKNLGFGNGNNLGINWALKNLQFDYLLLLNNDTLIEPDTLLNLTKPFFNDDKIGISTGKIMYEGNRDLVWYGGGEINYKKGWPKIADLNKIPTINGANKSRYVSFASGCLMMFSKESITTLKGFNESFFMYSEDLELCIRAQKLGYKIFYESKSLIYHKVNRSMKSKSKVTGIKVNNPNLDFQFFHKKVNQYKTMKLHLNMKDFIVFNFYFWLKYSFQTITFILKGKPSFIKISMKTLYHIVLK